jgi:hypothetical protein
MISADIVRTVERYRSKDLLVRQPVVNMMRTQEEQKILDKHMGRPEKPPSSAYSLFRQVFSFV